MAKRLTQSTLPIHTTSNSIVEMPATSYLVYDKQLRVLGFYDKINTIARTVGTTAEELTLTLNNHSVVEINGYIVKSLKDLIEQDNNNTNGQA